MDICPFGGVVMKKNEVESLILEQMLGNKRGVNVHLNPTKLAQNTVIKNWTDEIKPPTNDPISDFWFAFIDHSPNANFEHPVDYVFINDKTGEKHVVHGTSPPDNLKNLEKIM